VTPVISIAKHALATTTRPVALLYANRDRSSVIFDAALQDLARRHDGRLTVQHHLDDAAGFLEPAAIEAFVAGRTDADFCICGPAPFMELVERTLLGLGVEPEAIAIERFVTPAQAPAGPTEAAEEAEATGADGAIGDVPDVVVAILKGKKHELPYRAGDTVLETARRANVATPYSCEAGNCATCMAFVREGEVRMKVNDALDDDEVDEGWVLTCQSVPTSPTLVVEFEPL
jgi:ferredoxin-NADP reductase